jgi:hypothetical protein
MPMQFKNLNFEDHPVIPDAIQATAVCDNGKRISVVAGVGLYSTSKAGVRKRANNVEDVSSFEVMVGDGEVIGWQSREQINEIFKKNG